MIDGLKYGLLSYTPVSNTRLDPDARAYLNAVKDYDNVVNSRCINILVKNLKREGFWNTKGIFLPFYGASLEAYTINLYNPEMIATISKGVNANLIINAQELIIGFSTNDQTSALSFIFNNFQVDALVNNNETIGFYGMLEQNAGQAYIKAYDGTNAINFYGNTNLTSYYIRSYSSSATTINIGSNMVISQYAYHQYSRINTSTIVGICNDYVQQQTFFKTNNVPGNSTVTFLNLGATIYYYKGRISSIYLLSDEVGNVKYNVMRNVLEEYHYLK